jgi:hypothetical protein
MIRNDRRLPLTARRRRYLAYLTRYHRGRVPPAGDDRILDQKSDQADALRTILAILRAADALDGRQHADARPQIRFKLRGRKLKIRIGLATDCRRARKFFSRRRKFDLLEEVLGVKVDLRVKRFADDMQVTRRLAA